MYAVYFAPFEKTSRFSLRPAEQATHDNQLCFAKTGNAFALNVFVPKKKNKKKQLCPERFCFMCKRLNVLHIWIGWNKS